MISADTDRPGRKHCDNKGLIPFEDPNFCFVITFMSEIGYQKQYYAVQHLVRLLDEAQYFKRLDTFC